MTEKGDLKFIGFAWAASNEDDLAKLPDALDIETVDEPGGGKRVRLTEPSSHRMSK